MIEVLIGSVWVFNDFYFQRPKMISTNVSLRWLNCSMLLIISLL